MDIGTLIGFIITLLIFSYLLSDNFLYRLAVYAFVGITAAFSVIVTVESVILPLLDSTNEIIFFLIALLFTALLLIQPITGLGGINNIPLAFLVAVGAAVAMVGVIAGTLLPFVITTGQAVADLGFVNGLIMIIGVVTSLAYFQFGASQKNENEEPRRRLLNRTIATIGEGFIAVTFGTLYGAAILTSLTILTERIGFLFAGG